MTKIMRRLLAGEYVLVHMRGMMLLTIVRDEELASGSLCDTVGGKNQPTEVWERQWKGISSSCLCAGGYDKVGGRERRIRMGEELKKRKKGGDEEKKRKKPKERKRAEVEILHELPVASGHSQRKDRIRWSPTFLGDWVELDENCRTKYAIRWHWTVHFNNESMPLCQSMCWVVRLCLR